MKCLLLLCFEVLEAAVFFFELVDVLLELDFLFVPDFDVDSEEVDEESSASDPLELDELDEDELDLLRAMLTLASMCLDAA